MEYEITWKNFTEQLPGVVASIKSADFIAVDAEMSGLQRNEIGRGGSNDSLQLRYAVMRDSVHNYLAFQWGICTFHFDATKQEYTARKAPASITPAVPQSTVSPTSFASQGLTTSTSFGGALRNGICSIVCR